MTKPDTNWTITSKIKSNWTKTSKNDTDFAVNRDILATVDAYDSATDTYDGTGTSDGINYYDGYNANLGTPESVKKDTGWNP